MPSPMRAPVLVCIVLASVMAMAGCASETEPPSPTTPRTDESQVASEDALLPAATMTQVLNAALPPICEFPAGQLVDGSMVVETVDGQPLGVTVVEDLVRLGVLDGTESAGDALAVLSCNHGGVAWPQVVALMTSGGQVLGVQDLMELTGHGRERVHDLRIEDGAAQVEWFTGTTESDAAAFTPGSASATLRWDGSAVVVEDVEVRGVADALVDLRSAVAAGDTATVAAMVSPSVVEGGRLAFLDDPVTEETCSELMSSENMAEGECTLTYADPAGFVGLRWTMTDWDTWILGEVSSSWGS